MTLLLRFNIYRKYFLVITLEIVLYLFYCIKNPLKLVTFLQNYSNNDIKINLKLTLHNSFHISYL